MRWEGDIITEAQQPTWTSAAGVVSVEQGLPRCDRSSGILGIHHHGPPLATSLR